MMNDFGEYGSSTLHKRYEQKTPSRSKQRCSCGCKQRATHMGMANGVVLMNGCQLTVKRWVKNGND